MRSCTLALHTDRLQQAERSNPHSANSQSWLAACLSVIRLPGRDSHWSFHRGGRWFLSSKMLSRYRNAVALCWKGSHSKSKLFWGIIYTYIRGTWGRGGDRARERERERKWTEKGELRTIAATTRSTNNHQSTLWGTPSLLLWKTWWWGILGHQTPGLGPSPLWHPPLQAGH